MGVAPQQLEVAGELLDALNMFKIRLLLYNRRVFNGDYCYTRCNLCEAIKDP